MESSKHARDPEDPFSGAGVVWMGRAQMDGRMRQAILEALPDGATFGFNFENDRAWLMVSRPGDTETVYQEALRRLHNVD